MLLVYFGAEVESVWILLFPRWAPVVESRDVGFKKNGGRRVFCGCGARRCRRRGGPRMLDDLVDGSLYTYRCLDEGW